MARSAHRLSALVLPLLFVTACFSWQPLPAVGPAEILEEQGDLRFTLRNSPIPFAVADVSVVAGDTLSGMTTGVGPRLRIFAFSDIQKVEARRLHQWGTVVAIVLPIVLMGVITSNVSFPFSCTSGCS